MKEPKLIDFLLQMQEIDDVFIDEALDSHVSNAKQSPRFKLSALVAAVLAVVMLVSMTIAANDLMPLIIPEDATFVPDVTPDWAVDENGQFTSEFLEQLERKQTGGFARSDWEHLTAEDYRTLEKNEDGITYLEAADARQFVLDGTVIITDENGEPFKFLYNNNESVYTKAQKNLKLAQSNYFPTVGYIVDGEVFKKVSGFTDPDKLGAFGLVHEFDEDTEAYIFLHSDEPVYIDYVQVNSALYPGTAGGPTHHKYYFGEDDSNIQIADKYTGVIEIALEEAKDITIGNMISLTTSEDLLSNMKAGTEVQALLDFKLVGDIGASRWQIYLIKVNPETGEKEIIQMASQRSEGANVLFKIPEDGDYFIEFENVSFGYLHINATSVEINN